MLRALTPALAKRLCGQTVVGLRPQYWIDVIKKKPKADALCAYTVHHVFAEGVLVTAFELNGKNPMTGRTYGWRREDVIFVMT